MVEFDGPDAYTRSMVLKVIQQSNNLISLHAQLWNVKTHLEYVQQIAIQKRKIRLLELKEDEGVYIGADKSKAEYKQALIDLDKLETQHDKFFEHEANRCLEVSTALCELLESIIEGTGDTILIALFNDTKGDSFLAGQLETLYGVIEKGEDVEDLILSLPLFCDEEQEVIEDISNAASDETELEIVASAIVEKETPSTLASLINMPKPPIKELLKLCQIPQLIRT